MFPLSIVFPYSHFTCQDGAIFIINAVLNTTMLDRRNQVIRTPMQTVEEIT